MTITNYIPTSDNHLFQNIDNELLSITIHYFEYDGIIYVFRNTNRLNNNNTTTTRPENVRPENVRPENIRPENIRPENIRPDRNNNRITNYYNNRNRITNYDYIRNDYIRNY